jgi:hypothetical protein
VGEIAVGGNVRKSAIFRSTAKCYATTRLLNHLAYWSLVLAFGSTAWLLTFIILKIICGAATLQ